MSYQAIVELGYFAGRTLGHFHYAQLTRWQKALLKIDRRIQGYKQLPIEEESAMYEQRRFSVFQVESSSPTMRDAAPAFERAFANTESLASLWVPSNAEIDRDVLMRLMPKSIEMVGVTNAPLMGQTTFSDHPATLGCMTCDTAP